MQTIFTDKTKASKAFTKIFQQNNWTIPDKEVSETTIASLLTFLESRISNAICYTYRQAAGLRVELVDNTIIYRLSLSNEIAVQERYLGV